jgi:rSAM/selenodomain-associated transferase 1
MKEKLLIIFYRNPELGKVKTRLAAAVGDEKALAIYLKLATHTREVTLASDFDRVVYYSHHVDTEDNWQENSFHKKLQVGNDLGIRMYNAFENAFRDGYAHVCIIGTDCLELTSEILSAAFEQLKAHDVVIGPARDGGYYLLGMKQLHKDLFANKEWSTNTVAKRTIVDFQNLNLTYSKLATLSDIDREEDLPKGIFKV